MVVDNAPEDVDDIVHMFDHGVDLYAIGGNVTGLVVEGGTNFNNNVHYMSLIDNKIVKRQLH